MTAPVSACLIVRDDPHLPKTLASLAPHVAEIVIVYTGQGAKEFETWKETLRVETSLVFDHFTHASRPDGSLFDFAAPRDRSFALATQPYILWTDSDDLVEGLEHLPEILEKFQAAIRITPAGTFARICCPYECAYDEQGRCTSFVVRERLFFGRVWKWKRSVHERCELDKIGAKPLDLYEPRLVWKHQGALPGRSSVLRNLKILLEQKPDPLTLFDLGREYSKLPGDGEPAIECFTKYLQIAKIPEERAAACLHLSGLWFRREAPNLQKETMLETLIWAQKATQECGRFEDWYAYAKVQWMEAIVRSRPGMFELARRSGERALAAPTAGRYDSNPKDREVGIQELLEDCRERKAETIVIEYGGLTARLHRRKL